MSRGGSVGIAVANCIEFWNIVPNENVGNSNNEFLMVAQVAVLSGSECRLSPMVGIDVVALTGK